MSPTVRRATVTTFDNGAITHRDDAVATEEPLEIRVRARSGDPVSVAVTMRTPGHDAELAAGFLWGEGLISYPSPIRGWVEGGAIQTGGFQNIVTLTLDGDVLPPDFAGSARQFYMTSSCGVCGRASLESVEGRRPFELLHGSPRFTPAVIASLSDKMRAAQATFERTGGLHAAGLFDRDGNLLTIREDVGRHNAVDKIVGAAVLGNELPLFDTLLFVSGRASFELVQKAVMAGIPALAAVGAPSSLAVELAKDAGLTLLGFVRGERFNIYAGAERIGG